MDKLKSRILLDISNYEIRREWLKSKGQEIESISDIISHHEFGGDNSRDGYLPARRYAIHQCKLQKNRPKNVTEICREAVLKYHPDLNQTEINKMTERVRKHLYRYHIKK